jgi:hypothetical protein
MPHRTSIPERCNRPAWRDYPNGYRVCRDHAAMNDPDQRLSPDVLGPCDYPMDGLGAARYVRPVGHRCPRCWGPVFPAAYIPDVLCCPACSALWLGPGPDDCQACGAPLADAMPGLPRQCSDRCWQDAPDA